MKVRGKKERGRGEGGWLNVERMGLEIDGVEVEERDAVFNKRRSITRLCAGLYCHSVPFTICFP